MAKESPSKRMYKDSPKIEHGEDGKAKVSRPARDAKAEKVQSGTEGVEENGSPDGSLPMPARHAMERREMHNRHETEQSMHKGDKKMSHERHEKEMKEMHARHEKEMMSAGGKPETKPEEGNEKEKASKVEKKDKE